MKSQGIQPGNSNRTLNSKKKISFFQILLLLAVSSGFHANAQMRDDYTVQESVDPVEMVMEYLVGSGVSVSNITYQGNPVSRGTFNGISNLGMTEGIILTSGRASFSTGPNNTYSKSFAANAGGDAALNLLGGSATTDACVLEFDFIAIAETFKLRYILGSEEYPEYVNQFNDVAGIFLSGPGITGSFPSPPAFPDGAINIAVVPASNPSLNVSIDNINNGSANNGPCTNCQYYVHNGFGNTPELDLYIQYDGFTTVLEAGAAVVPGETYHIKLAVADSGDDSFDSALFFESGSFTTGINNVELPVARIFTDGTMLRIISESNGQALFAITSVTGNVLSEGSFTGNDFSLSLKDFPAGVYIVRVVMNGRQSVAKIIR